MTRVIHTGDTHVGYQQYHSPVRRQDFLDAFDAVIDAAVTEDVDAVVHAGDLFHDRQPELADLLGVLETLRTLDDAGIPFLAIVGNHEATRGGQWLDLFASLDLAVRLDASPTVVGDVAFYGLDHVPSSRRDDLEYAFEPHETDTAVLVAHGLFTPFTHGSWETETLLQESTVDFDALLLGDNHTPDTAEVAGTWVTYPGSTERTSASEREPRGYNIVDLNDDVEIRRRTLETRDFVFVDVTLGEGEGVDRVRQRVREYDIEDAVVIVEISGDGDPVTPAAVEEYATEKGALIARVTDRRDRATDSEITAEFTDPDEAVRERIAGLGLSPVGREIDETVRTPTVADSNVRAEVKRQVEARLADEELAAGTRVDEEHRNKGDESASEPDSPDEDGQLTLGDST